jgi:hypothetical protein
MYRYAKVINGELWIRQKAKNAPWEYVCHELEIGKAPINNNTIKDFCRKISNCAEIISSKMK